MSGALRASKARAGVASGGAFISRSELMGDPGLFGFIGNVLKTAAGAIPGPIGTISRSLFPTSPRVGAAITPAPTFTPFSPPVIRTPGFFPVNVAQEFPNGRGTPAGAPTTGGAAARFFPGGETGLGTGCASGFHPNKSAYFLKNGTFVEAGSRCVKNRRRNPLNPRAASRAISRLESAKKAVTRINRITIRCPRCVKGAKCPTHR